VQFLCFKRNDCGYALYVTLVYVMISYVLLTMCYFITNLLIFSDIHIQLTYARFYELGLTRDS